MSVIINTSSLSKTYRVHKKEPGLVGSLKSLVRRRYENIPAVQNINLTITEGELVGFIGPNGAGKTTTLKMLAGLLHPTTGTATVLGFTPSERRKDFLKNISLVMGQKQQLWWDLPLYDSLLLQRDIYEMNPAAFATNLAELTKLLDLESFLKIQVRKLSLGQRMRGELAAAFLYRPRVLFLDEPTIGLDVLAQRAIRQFIADYQQRHHATIILTSHNLADVQELAQRLIIIDHGQIMFDGQTSKLMARYIDHKRVTLTFDQPVAREKLAQYGRVVSFTPEQATLHLPRADTQRQAAAILTELSVHDITIDEPSLEDVVRELFTKRDYA